MAKSDYFEKNKCWPANDLFPNKIKAIIIDLVKKK